MDIVISSTMTIPEQATRMECNDQGDDLLGEELAEMEDGESVHVVWALSYTKKGHKSKGQSLSWSGARVGAPLGLQSKKAEFFRWCSPKKRHASSSMFSSCGETGHQRHRHSESKKLRASSLLGNGLVGSTKTLKNHL